MDIIDKYIFIYIEREGKRERHIDRPIGIEKNRNRKQGAIVINVDT